ncbi:proprotein convertase subtilisin/kexin type 4-like [Osmerus eperlanus]|uniref:proprotein convertase subtilisin/kexin type 4-like n=1 Tax=Osmerus eperlanus TaxID=29151 RepID=UPI002E151529
MKYIVLIFSLCCPCVAGVIFTNSWALLVSGDAANVDNVAKKYGFLNLGKIFPDGNFYHMVQRQVARKSFHAQHLNLRLDRDPTVLWYSQQYGKIRVSRNIIPPTDPYFSQQWYLSEDYNQNVVAAWAQGYTGRGVVVSILDDGLETSHPDLSGNYDPQASYDMNDNDPYPDTHYSKTKTKSHGTQCAGVVAAMANNSVCGVGVAYQSKIGAVRMLDGLVTDLIETRSLNWNQQHIDIYSSSWGPDDRGQNVEGPSPLTQEAFIRGISQGRGGLGSIYVWASGNGGTNFDNCNCDGYTNSIYTISVGSTTERGTVPFYSEPCSAILTTTYSGGSFHHRRIVTTNLHHTCTSDLTGTSASASLASGIIALALEANPTLTWRDVQHLVVRASRPAELNTSDWKTNGAGRVVSHYYGFGLLDAGKMVNLARKWRAVQPQRKCVVDVITRPHELRQELTWKWNETACYGTKNWIQSLEHLQARLTLTSARRGDLSIILTSPMGTTSNLLTIRPYDSSSAGFSDWAFTSTHCWDENPSGHWILQIKNNGDLFDQGRLLKFQLELYGSAERMAGHRMQRTMVQECAVRDTDGSCAECVHPLIVFESVCLVACPPHYYESDGNGTHRCLPCHRSCHTCFGKWNTDCLECPPYSTFDPRLSICNPPVYPWSQRRNMTISMDRTAAVLSIFIGGPVVILTVMLIITSVVNRVFLFGDASINQASRTSNEEEAMTGVEMVMLSVSEEQTGSSQFPSPTSIAAI